MWHEYKNKKINPVGNKNENKVNFEEHLQLRAIRSHYQTKIIPPNSVLMGYLINGYKPTKAQFEQMTHIAISFLRLRTLWKNSNDSWLGKS